ncbi:acetyl-CoA carboxylase biotin carboxyl carrier protein [Brevibacillus sp. GCM10020057]|uniref:acetyl-CoA carboxylase biotin carboxyl carrier protein n=1 Tax=Brevibacillus sp. GCM10020057 TaxID=3317327 RepID=UPI00363D6833
MKLHDIRELVKLVQQTAIEELEWEQGATSIVIKKAAPAVVAAVELPLVQTEEVDNGYEQAAATAEVTEAVQETQAPAAVTQTIFSPAVGVFTATVAIGQQVKAGDVVGRCSVDALQLSHDILSPVDGEVTDIFAADGQLVDYGKALMAVKQS